MIDAFAELYEIENEDILVVDVGRYGFVKMQCYVPSYGFEELWDEWLNRNLFLIAMEMQLDDIVGEEVFNTLPKEKQSELIGRKADFAQKVGISL